MKQVGEGLKKGGGSRLCVGFVEKLKKATTGGAGRVNRVLVSGVINRCEVFIVCSKSRGTRRQLGNVKGEEVGAAENLHIDTRQ